MKIFYNQVLKNSFLITGTLLFTEILMRIFLHLPIFDWALLRIFIGINIIAWFFGVLFTFAKRTINNLFVFFFCFLFSLYGYVQAGFYRYIGNFFSMKSISYIFSYGEEVELFFANIPFYYLFLFFPLFLLFVFILFIDKKVQILELNEQIDFSDKFDSLERKQLNEAKVLAKKKRILLSNRLGSLFIICIFCFLFYLTTVVPFMQNSLQIENNKLLFRTIDIPTIAVSQYGYSVYAFLDVKNVLFPSLTYEEENEQYLYGYDKQDQKIGTYTRYIDDSLWERAIAEERNQNYKLLSQYYISQEITDKNDYTGMFKNKKLVFIMMDSTNDYLINEELFPNVYKLYKEGWSFSNAYSSRSLCSGDNEIASIVSLYPLNNQCILKDYASNVYPESLFHLFREAGYETSSYYNYTNKEMNRSLIHPNLGSGKYYGVSELGIPYSEGYKEWPSDVELIHKMLTLTEDQEKFMVWLTSASARAPYTEASELGDKYLDILQDTNYSLSTKRYLSKLKEFDNAIGILLEGLAKQEKLEDTVIVLYGNTSSSMLTELSLHGEGIEKNRVPFVIYNPTLTSTQYKTFTSYVNLTPTLANLFDLSYDPRLYVGKDIFSNTYENRVIFSDGSWQDNKGHYSSPLGKFIPTNVGDSYEKEELKKINQEVGQRILLSQLAIKTNYFQSLYARFNSYKVSSIE